jgi:hypothetical protein
VFRGVCAFQGLHGLESTSEAIRALLEIAMRDTKTLDDAFRRAAWRTGVRGGAKKLTQKVQAKLDEAVREALGVPDSEIVRG